MSAAEEEAVNIIIDAAGERFRTAASQVHAGIVWRKVSATPTRALLGLAWAADLLIVDLNGRSEGGTQADELVEILRKSQQAILVRTHPGRRLALKRALILWDQTPACRRAINAALPLLSKAEYIVVVTAKQSYLVSAKQALSDLERGLRIRDLPVQLIHERACDPAETVDDYINRFDPDVLVMSGRNRWGSGSLVDRLHRYQTYAAVSM